MTTYRLYIENGSIKWYEGTDVEAVKYLVSISKKNNDEYRLVKVIETEAPVNVEDLPD